MILRVGVVVDSSTVVIVVVIVVRSSRRRQTSKQRLERGCIAERGLDDLPRPRYSRRSNVVSFVASVASTAISLPCVYLCLHPLLCYQCRTPSSVLLIRQINLGCLLPREDTRPPVDCNSFNHNVGLALTNGLSDNELYPRIFPLAATLFSCKYQVNTMCFLVGGLQTKHNWWLFR